MAVTNYHGQYTGAGQTVVIIDTGATSQFINNNVIYQWDFADNDDNTYSTQHTHGGAVATVAQDVASDINIIHLKVFSDDSDGASVFTIETALQWVAKNADVYDITAVNMSVGFNNLDTYNYNGWLLDEEYQALDDMEIITTVAAGNGAAQYSQDGVNYLAADDSVIAVSATDTNNEFASFSQRHEDLTDIAALGSFVPVGNRYFSGTSFAAPIIAGAAAIIQEMAVDLLGHKITDEQFLELIQSTADVIDPASYQQPSTPSLLWSPSGNWGGGWLGGPNQPVDTLNGSEVITPITDPGGSIDNAYKIAPQVLNHVTVFNQSLVTTSATDFKDYFAFTLDNDATVSINLTNLQADVDLVLYDSGGRIIESKWEWGNVDLNITADLNAGQTYYIGVVSFDKQATDYGLTIDFNGGINIGPPVVPDEQNSNPDVDHINPDADPGERITEAYELDPAANQVVITESLGPTDDKDYYAFTLDNTAEVSFSLTDLVGDVDLILKSSTGHTLTYKWKPGNQDLNITELLEANETYYIVTDSWDRQNTDYTLSINFNGGYDIDEDAPAPAPEDPANPDPSRPPGYAGINIANAVDYFQENHQDYAVV